MPKRTPTIRGKADSSWLVARRCLALVNRLMAGVATKAELMDTVQAEFPEEPYLANPKRFENDKSRLREKLGVVVRYSKEENGYVLVGSELLLFKYSITALENML